jgi:hypothetical protein
MNKKRFFRLTLIFAAVIALFAGCFNKDFDEELLIGTWSASDGYTYHFHEDYTGSSEKGGRGLNFTWDLNADELHLRYTGSGSSSISAHQTFILESLTETRMEAYDENDPDETIITFRKQ